VELGLGLCSSFHSIRISFIVLGLSSSDYHHLRRLGYGLQDLVCNSKDGKSQAGAEIYWINKHFFSIFGHKASIRRSDASRNSIEIIMKIHPKFLWITFGNLLACFIASYFLDRAAGDYWQTVGVNVFFGWLFWILIFSQIAPLFFSDKERDIITASPYLSGTIVMCIVNLIGTIFCCYYASTFFPFRES